MDHGSGDGMVFGDHLWTVQDRIRRVHKCGRGLIEADWMFLPRGKNRYGQSAERFGPLRQAGRKGHLIKSVGLKISWPCLLFFGSRSPGTRALDRFRLITVSSLKKLLNEAMQLSCICQDKS
jgi:hypothetical protein